MDALPEFNIKNIETSLVRELFPRDMRERSENFIKFIEDYYAFLNSKDNPSYVIERIIAEHDIDTVIDEKYLDKIKAEIASLVPTSPYVQKAFLLKRIIELYDLRGNEESVKYFFRVFFNEDVTIYNPWNQVLIPSQGKWVQSMYVRLVLYCGNESLLTQTKLYQYDDRGRLRATMSTRAAERKQYSGRYYFDVEIQRDTINGIFTEEFEVRDETGKVRGRFSRMLDDIVIEDGGKGYAIGDRLYLGSMEDISFSAVVSNVDIFSTTIKNIKVYDSGLSSSVNYFSDVKNETALIKNLSEVYIKGTLTGDGLVLQTLAPTDNEFELIYNSEYATEEIDVDNVTNIYLNRPVNVYGIVDSKGLNVLKISSATTGGLLLHDFKYYDEDDADSLNMDKELRSLPNVFVYSQKNTRSDRNTDVAQFKFRFGIFYETDGYYADTKGRPSGFSVLQDSFYYQVFSYEINSKLPIVQWKSQLDELIHPAGFKVFNRIDLGSSVDSGLEITSDPYDFSIDANYIPPSIIHTDQFGFTSTVNFNMQDYIGYDPYSNEASYFLERYTTTLIDLIPLVYDDPYSAYDGDAYDSYYDAYDSLNGSLLVYYDPYDPYTYQFTYSIAAVSTVTENSMYFPQDPYDSYIDTQFDPYDLYLEERDSQQKYNGTFANKNVSLEMRNPNIWVDSNGIPI